MVARLKLVAFAAEDKDEDGEEVFWAKRADPEFTKRLLAGLEGAAEVRRGMQVKMDVIESMGRGMVQ